MLYQVPSLFFVTKKDTKNIHTLNGFLFSCFSFWSLIRKLFFCFFSVVNLVTPGSKFFSELRIHGCFFWLSTYILPRLCSRITCSGAWKQSGSCGLECFLFGFCSTEIFIRAVDYLKSSDVSDLYVKLHVYICQY